MSLEERSNQCCFGVVVSVLDPSLNLKVLLSAPPEVTN